MPYELFIALRYLRAKRRQMAVSVITGVAILGVTIGVAALLVALALIKGFRHEIQDKILQGTAHLNLLRADGGNIENYGELAAQISTVPGVVAASATSYEPVLLTIGDRSEQAIIKGVDLTAQASANEVFAITVEGDAKQLSRPDSPAVEDSPAGIIIGKELARTLGLQLNARVTVVSAATSLTPAGMLPRPRYTSFRVVGFFASGLYEYDSKWAYIALDVLQQLSGKGNTAGVIQMRVADIYAVSEIGARVQAKAGAAFITNNWQELNRPLFAALQLQQRIVVIFFILLIAVAMLNIITTLTLMVVEKHKDVAILRAQGATAASIGRIFCLQGISVGVIGTVSGFALGVILYWLINAYHLIAVPAEIYSISHVTLQLRVIDCLGVCLTTVFISFLATLYPAYTAAKLQPVEVLRYE
ncbi:MAG: ABC transporter permease [Acidobacteria bacterium]|nr:ABC transporter permease [Acidobacteriota bacterium]MBI3425975.1 ABC transporter permease [Acidobacteriota bacterium]